MSVTIEEVDLALAASWEAEVEEESLLTQEDELNEVIDSLRPHKTEKLAAYHKIRHYFDKKTSRYHVFGDWGEGPRSLLTL